MEEAEYLWEILLSHSHHYVLSDLNETSIYEEKKLGTVLFKSLITSLKIYLRGVLYTNDVRQEGKDMFHFYQDEP